MTSELQEQIRKFTLADRSQKEIARALGCHRNKIYYWQKKMGLSHQHTGPRKPQPSEMQESEILELLRTGMGTKRISEKLGLRWDAVRTVSEAHDFHHVLGKSGCRYRVPDSVREKIVSEIIGRRNFCRTIALKYNVADKYVRKLAHELLGVSAFRSGYGEPLLSNFPQKHHDRKLSADA